VSRRLGCCCASDGWLLGHEEATRPYLCAAVRARGAHNVVRGGRSDIAHVVFAHLVFLRIVFYLWWGQPRAASMHDCSLYLGVVRVASAIAVDRRRVDSGGVRAGRRKVVRGV
jgi:hypothetical protein